MVSRERTGKWPLAMIGVDAADLDFIRANLAALPNFRRALDTGITRKLQSTAGALTGSVWPTFFSKAARENTTFITICNGQLANATPAGDGGLVEMELFGY